MRAPAESLFGLSLVLIGLPVYLIWGRTRPGATNGNVN
jgi:hypothetical protein